MQLNGVFEPLLAQLNSGVVVLDNQYRLVFFNQFIARRANLILAAVQGQSLFDVFDDLPKAWLQRNASEPPRKMVLLPDLMHKPAASTVTFGRLS